MLAQAVTTFVVRHAFSSRQTTARLTVPLEADALAPLVGGTLGRAKLGRALALAGKTTGLAARGGEPAELPVLVRRVADPVDPRVVADGRVERVHHNHFEPLVHGVLPNPVGVEHTKAAALASHTFFGNTPQVPRRLDLVHTRVFGLTVHNTLAHLLLPATPLDAHTVDAVPGLGLVTKTTGLVRAGGPGCPVNGRHLTVLPASDTLQETVKIRLLLARKLFQVLVGTHV